jgi:periplasmic protein TonB
MNIQRYGIPVIVAAAIHGSLFLIGGEDPIVIITAPTKSPVFAPPPVEEPIQMRSEEDHDTSPAGGPVKSLPSTPDVIAPVTSHTAFTVRVEPYRPSLDPVKTLEPGVGYPSDLGVGDPNRFGRPNLVGVGDLDRNPRAMAQPSPAYPHDLRNAGVDGAVVVEFVVDTTGRVVKADATRWTHREFVDPAVRAVLRWRFEPGTIGGRKVSFRMAVPIEFNATR